MTAPTLSSTSDTTNRQNELTAVGGNSMVQNDDGATTTDSDGYHYTYDAWGHIISTTNSGNASNSSYAYDALGREIIESPYNSGYVNHDLYYSQTGQVIEEKYQASSTCCNFSSGGSSYCCTATDLADEQYVSGAGYIDDLVLRDDIETFQDKEYEFISGSWCNIGSSCSSNTNRLYVQQDANYNVTALTNTSGTVEERFVYDPYGNRQVLSASWASTSDAYNWIYGFQGGRMDPATGLIRFGARDYSPSDGRWVEPDPAGYVDGMNIYQAMGSNTVSLVDPMGLEWTVDRDPTKAWATATGEAANTLDQLADKLKLNIEESSKWAKKIAGTKNCYEVPNVMVVDLGNSMDFHAYLWTRSLLFPGPEDISSKFYRTATSAVNGDFEKYPGLFDPESGELINQKFKIIYTDGATDQQIKQHLKTDGIYGYFFFGHGDDAGSLNTSNGTNGVRQGKYTNYGLAFMWLYACYSATPLNAPIPFVDKDGQNGHTAISDPLGIVWRTNVARSGVFEAFDYKVHGWDDYGPNVETHGLYSPTYPQS